jgi:hypothetical protein
VKSNVVEPKVVVGSACIIEKALFCHIVVAAMGAVFLIFSPGRHQVSFYILRKEQYHGS